MPSVTVHFATNRNETFNGDVVTGFGNALNPKSPAWVRYGAADMVLTDQDSGKPYSVAEIRVAPEIVPLGERERADALALTALVYPHYFRPRTMELGRYFGMYVDGRLAAMVGERLGAPDMREMSAICTHPDFRGRGLALGRELPGTDGQENRN